LLLFTSITNTQIPTNFSGTWAFDKSKSNPGEGGSFLDGDEILVITQNSTSISLEKTLIRQGSDDIKSTDTYNLGGTETIEKSDMGITKKSAKWSEDKQILTITTIMTFSSNITTNEYRVDDSYKLSDNGKTLTNQSISKNPIGERTIIQVYTK
jgi:hypothetical protein